MTDQQTSRSTRRLSEVARHVVYPADIVSTGWPEVEAKLAEIGIQFYVWQAGLAALILGKRADGKYAATVGGVTLSIPRQVAKTFLVSAIIFALCLIYPNLTVVWTAHRTRTSNETFRKLKGMAARAKIKPHVLAIRSTNGEQEITFRNGSRIMFGAREQGFGRGFTEVDIEVFDEAQILTEKALEDMVAAMNQSRFPAGALMFLMGTPPRPIDPGEVFANKRARALAGNGDGMVYVEMSADEDADPDDREQPLALVPLIVTRECADTFAPADDFALAPGDELVVAGHDAAMDVLDRTLFHPDAVEYVATGNVVPATWIFRKLSPRVQDA